MGRAMPPLPTIPPWKLIEPVLLYGILPAFVLAIIVTAAVRLIFGQKQATLAAALGIATGVGFGLYLLKAMPPEGELTWLTPGETADVLFDALKLAAGESTWNRLPWAALLALWVGRVARMPNVPPFAGWFLRVGASAGAAWLVISPETRKESEWLAPALAAVILAEWALLEHLCVEGQRDADDDAPAGRGSIPLLIAMAFFAAGVVLMHASWNSGTEIAIVLASAFAGIAVVAGVFGMDAGGAVPVAAVMLPGLTLDAYLTTDGVSWQAFPLAGLAPLVLVEALPFQHRRGFVWTVLRFILLLIPLAAAVWLALHAGPLEHD